MTLCPAPVKFLRVICTSHTRQKFEVIIPLKVNVSFIIDTCINYIISKLLVKIPLRAMKVFKVGAYPQLVWYVLSRLESLIPLGQDTIPSQVNSPPVPIAAGWTEAM